MKKQKHKPLALKVETIRKLTADELRGAAGGAILLGGGGLYYQQPAPGPIGALTLGCQEVLTTACFDSSTCGTSRNHNQVRAR
jgi:hypothetical protein